ncbi:glycosyltransferase family 1 protein [Phanerochaete sordida]|uniref:Glycosyltransferase family 1 protein n=1 Tax=Phanerochaete sordida TaxID=48140 RepID=A0A9P3GQU5_9APHY|nr:glycosyltransferase family 1 protein [Phanerochaete sordida]
MLVVGLFGYRFLEIARQRSRSMKILVVLAASMLSLEVLVEPFGADTHRQLERKVRQHMGKTGKSLLEAAEEVLLRPSDAIVQPLGLPAMHSHEIYPQKLVTQHPMVGYLHLTVANLTHECEDMIVCSMTCIEPPKVVQTLTDFFALTSRKMHIVGPVVRLWKTTEQTMAEQSPGVASFIDGLLQMHGRQSMVYISFGTVFWSSQPEMVWTLLDVLLEKSIPFIMAQASPLCQLPEHVAQKVRTSRIGLITPWAPQQLILEHPATGWFVTHGGFNSILESVHAGVPMICWPFAADQPLNTVQLTENLDIAYELLEVRTGEPGLKPIYRTGKAPKGTLAAVREETRAVLDRAFGEDGARKRGNILKLREVSLGMWAERGAGRLAAEEMLSSIGL